MSRPFKHCWIITIINIITISLIIIVLNIIFYYPHHLMLGGDGPHGGGKVVICISFEVFVQMERQASIKGVNHFA